MVVVVPTAALNILSNLRISLLRAAEIAGLQILAQGLELLLQLRLLRLRAGTEELRSRLKMRWGDGAGRGGKRKPKLGRPARG